MNDPIKIIFKFKNNNRRTQYHMHIFVGDVPKNILKIIKKLKIFALAVLFLTYSRNLIWICLMVL